MSARGISIVVLPAVKIGRLKMYACAAMANARVLIASRSPRDAQGADADDDRDQTGEGRAEHQRPRERDARQPPVEESGLVPPDVEREAPDQGAGRERAETGEGHLAERQLAAPAREHDHRDRARVRRR